LDEILVGPVPVGLNKFVLQADPPDPSRLPPDEVLGVTVVLVTCSYRDKEFVRVGFYVNNEYLHPDYVAPPPASSAMPMSGVGDGGQATEAHLNAGSTDPNAVSADPNTGSAAADATSGTISDKPLPVYPNLDMSLVQRHILADKPRITKFPISWGAETEDSTSFKMATNASAGSFDANYETSMAVAGSSNSLSASSPASPMNTSMDVLMEG
jgi:histone chaperone ASF1